MKEALFYDKLNNLVQCKLCPHNCIIQKNSSGFCKVRKNINNKLIALTYNKPVSIAIDPIEKKPLYHFNPGKPILSIGTFGCNLACKHCQNYTLSREFDQNQINSLDTIEPEDIIKVCHRDNLHMIAYTYNEPTVFYEYMLDIAKLAKKHKIQNVMISNGYINPEPLKKLLPFIDAANIDLKAFSNQFYKTNCSAKLSPILETLKTIAKSKCHLEITNLVVPTKNDNMKEFKDLCRWIKDNLGDIPLHISRFFPHYKMQNIPPTPIQTLSKAEEIAKKYLTNVHLGNIH